MTAATTNGSGIAKALRWRWRELWDAKTWPLGIRLDRVNPLTPWRSHDDYLLRSRFCDGDGERYFSLAGRRVYYSTPELPVEDEQKHVDATLTILREAYLFNDLLDDPHLSLSPGDVVLDLGGNIGTSAMHFAPLVQPGGKIYSFEPITHAITQHNIGANGLNDVVEVVPKAVADREGEIEFDTNDSYIDSSFTRVLHDPDAANRRSVKAPVTTVDAFVAERKLGRVDLIKMDIEGAEELAMEGAVETIRRFKPRWTISSYHLDQHDERQHPKLVAKLKEHGYAVREVGQKHIYAWPSA